MEPSRPLIFGPHRGATRAGPRTSWAALALPALAACTTTYSLEEFDALARSSGARTIVLDLDLSLYSPYDPIRTRAYLELIREQKAEVFALFGVARERPLAVVLHPDPTLGVELSVQDDRIAVESVSEVTGQRIAGQAGIDVVVIEVDPERVLRLPDGRSIPGAFEPTQFTDTIRHELTHVATRLLGIERREWLSEGIAHAVGSFALENGRFVLDPVPADLREAASLAHDAHALEEMLEWHQGFPVTDADVSARRLATSLVLFALARDGAADLRQGILRLSTLERSEILALQPEWSAWLDRFALPSTTRPREPTS